MVGGHKLALFGRVVLDAVLQLVFDTIVVRFICELHASEQT